MPRPDDAPDPELRLPRPRRVRRVNTRGKALVIIGGCFAVMFLGCAGEFGKTAYDHYRVSTYGVDVEGQVTGKRYYTTRGSKGSTSHHYEVTFRFQANGTWRGAAKDFSSSAYNRLEVGSPLAVRYDPEDPGNYEVEGISMGPAGTLILCGVMGLVFGGVGGCMILFPYRRWWREAELVRDGIAVGGLAAGLEEKRSGRTSNYYLTVKFVDDNRQEREERVQLYVEEFRALSIGQKVSVLHDRNDPRRFVVYQATSFRAV